jgi:8-oxo-dGTP diphosphatase
MSTPNMRQLAERDSCANCTFLRYGPEEGADKCSLHGHGIAWSDRNSLVCDDHKRSEARDPRVTGKARFHGMKDKPNTPKVGVGVVLRDRDNRVLLGLRKGSHGAGLWSLPGGHMEIGEGFFEVCRREVYEETGITISSINQLTFTNDFFEKEGLHYVTLFFEAQWSRCEQPVNREPDKLERWEWMLPEELECINLFSPLKQVFKTLKQED